jgi:diaminopropionate ammonia-lyase
MHTWSGFSSQDSRLWVNSNVVAAEPAWVRPDDYSVAQRSLSAFDEYAVTPLRSLCRLSTEIGVRAVWYKDESQRFGIGSFKALGAPYAAARWLMRELGLASSEPEPALRALLSGELRAQTGDVVFASATDGNHGRALAWGAQRFGCGCQIYVPSDVTENRVRAIERYGARVTRVAGNYDDAVHAIARDAAERGWQVVSDTSYTGYQEIPRDVMIGYTVMVAEAMAQISPNQMPTHVFVQAGVGALAAAVIAYVWHEAQRRGSAFPRVVIVEPLRAACVYESARAGRPVRVRGDLHTVMGGLACGEVSELAWPLMRDRAAAYMAIDDAAAEATMRLLAWGDASLAASTMRDEAPAIVGGESGVAGLAGAIVASSRADMAAALDLGPDSTVLVFGTEGATDPERYAQIVDAAPNGPAHGQNR